MTAAVASLRTNAANVRRFLPNWVWGLIFIGLALLYPYILDQLLVSPDDLDEVLEPLRAVA